MSAGIISSALFLGALSAFYLWSLHFSWAWIMLGYMTGGTLAVMLCVLCLLSRDDKDYQIAAE